MEEWLREVPGFDDALLAIVGSLVGTGGLVYAIVFAAFKLASWSGPLRASFWVARKTHRIGTRMYRMRPSRGVASVIVTIFVLVAQIVTVFACFVGGNWVALIFDDGREGELRGALYDMLDDKSGILESGLPLLQWDVYSYTYVSAGVVGIALSYVLTPRCGTLGDTSKPLGRGLWRRLPLTHPIVRAICCILAGPALVTGVLLAFGGFLFLLVVVFYLLIMIVALLLADDFSAFFSDFWPEFFAGPLTGTALVLLALMGCAAYTILVSAGLVASRATIGAWRTLNPQEMP